MEDIKKTTAITIPISYLEEVMDYSGRSLVGKLLKRFEIIENRDILKSEAKELIYEEVRRMKEILIAFEKGRTISIFNFKTKESKGDTNAK